MSLATLFQNFLIDLDGVVYLGDSLIPGADSAIDSLVKMGKVVLFITNDPRRSSEGYAEKLSSLGIKAKPEQVITSASALAHHIEENFDAAGKSAFVVGSQVFKRRFEQIGLRVLSIEEGGEADFVIVGGHDEFNYAEMKAASLAVRAGAHFFATNRDPCFPTSEGLVPGTGAILSSIEAASGKTATIGGKPEAMMFEAALSLLDNTDGTVVIGDGIDSDILGGRDAGLKTILVLSGSTTAEQAGASTIKPDYIIEDITGIIEE